MICVAILFIQMYKNSILDDKHIGYITYMSFNVIGYLLIINNLLILS